ncbi:MAG: ABC transporter ATP-binding protein [Planctomycetota bacterium]
MPAPPIEIADLHLAYGPNDVLRGVTLRVNPGETVALLGRNGAGKSTLIRTLMGLQKAGQGSAKLFGQDPRQDPIEVRQRVGYLAEDQRMWPWMRVEQIARFLAPFYPTWDHDLMAELLKRFELPLRTKIKHLSKGQGVRLGLALSLAHRPKLAVLDDPALGLDPIARRQFNRDLVEHLQADGVAVLYSSHLLGEVEAVADRVAILADGRITVDTPPEDLRADIRALRVPADLPDDALPLANHPVLLDETRGRERRLVVRGGIEAEAALRASGHAYTAEGLSLDDIFEALDRAPEEVVA